MLHKIIIFKYKLAIIFVVCLYVTTCHAMYKIDIETKKSDDEIQVSDDQYSAMENTPLLPKDYTIVDYGAINNNFIVENQFFSHSEMIFSRRSRLYIAISIGSSILGMFGVLLLALNRVEGFFILILSISYAIFSRKIVRMFC